jgi:serine/threonine protein kinase/Tol biopolymer transport system component
MANDHKLIWYEKVHTIVGQVQLLPEEERSAALDRACASDSVLRARVERELLNSTNELPSSPDALDEEADPSFLFPMDEPLTGQIFHHYLIQELLGEGGMGKVYAAWDEKLRRWVAIKFLPANFTQDQGRIEKFRKEAQMASALNHPGIVTIHDIDEVAGRHFIVMELVEGKTLRQHLADQPGNTGKLSPLEVIGIGQQIIKVLKTTSRSGIVHRDLKPENLMLTTEGQIKVLDFGLARLVTILADTELPAGHSPHPGSGLFGTPNYMSPEHLRGQPLDWRSDIFSFGVLLYEMIAGRRPFRGEHPEELQKSILEETPLPLRTYCPECPTELSELIARCLAKEPNQRPESLQKIENDLHESLDKPRRPKQSPRTPFAAAAYLLILLLGALMIIGNLIYPAGARALARQLTRDVTAHLHELLLQNNRSQVHKLRLELPGQMATISHTGDRMVYISQEDNLFSVWVKDLRTNLARSVVPPGPDGYLWPTISPDNKYAYLVRVRDVTPPHVKELLRVSLAGQSLDVLSRQVDSPVTFSPDGRRIAYIREQKEKGLSTLMIAEADGSSPRALRQRQLPDFYTADGPAWSPDGQQIATTAGCARYGIYFDLVGIQVKDGRESPLTRRRWEHILGIGWLPSAEGLIILGKTDPRAFERQVFFISAKTGTEEQLTHGEWDYPGRPSIPDNSQQVFTVRRLKHNSLWFNTPEKPDHFDVYSNRLVMDDGLSWTPRKEIVFAEQDEQGRNLWISDLNGQRRQLTRNVGLNQYPVVSPDNRGVVFSSNQTGQTHIYWIDIEGKKQRQLTFGANEREPEISPNGRWVVYSGLSKGRRSIWRVPIEGGKALPITERAAESAVISPDGKWIACIYHEDDQNASGTIAIIPFEGGPPIQRLTLPVPNYRKYRFFRWSPDGKGLEYIHTQDRVSNVWRQPLDGGPAVPVTDFVGSTILDFRRSPDGRQLLCLRSYIEREVVAIQRPSWPSRPSQ